MRFKCKRCGKFINVENEEVEEISCPYCETLHCWLYENGWGYYEKDYIKKKCPLCGDYTFIKRDLFNQGKNFFKTPCDSCKSDLFVKNEYSKVVLFPYKYLLFKCEWCGEQLECNVENVNDEYIEKQNDTFAKHIEKCNCPKCNNKTEVYYSTEWEDRIYTQKVPKTGRKKKINKDVIDDFINNNYLYKRYGILHPYNIVDFCDTIHYDYDEVEDYIIEKKFEIFVPMDLEEINALKVKKYEKQFDRLILKENAMKEAGGASLSRLLGQRKVWKNLRSLLITQNNSTCKICGHKVENTRSLHVHEVWKVYKNIVELIDVELICSDCHACKHRNQFFYRVVDGADPSVYGIPRIDFLTIHLMKVNNVSKEVIYAYRKRLLKELDDFERQRIEKFSLNEENTYDEVEYKYIIGEKIPLKNEIELVLKEKGLLL